MKKVCSPEPVFDDWAEYYDLIHDGLPGDKEFYLAHSLRIGGEVLELGIGTGRLGVALAASGLCVTGVDDSPDMLAVCREKIRAHRKPCSRLTLVESDIVKLNLGKTFPCVLMPYRTFMHFLSKETQRAALKTVHAHLADDGEFLFDTWNPSIKTLQTLSRRSIQRHLLEGIYPLPPSRRVLAHYCRTTCDRSLHRLTEEHLFHECNAQGVVLRETTLPLVRMWTMPHELEKLLYACGFEVLDVMGDFEGKALSEESIEMVWRLKKARRDTSRLLS